jgi:hypothetical protein
MNELEVLEKSLNISALMLIATLVVSLATITFGALNMAFQRSHNRKSVRPYCNVHKAVSDRGICISIMNAGLGPMLIDRVAVVEKGQGEAQAGIPLASAIPSGIQYDTVINNTDVYVLPSMGETKLFEYSVASGDNAADLQRIRSKLEGCTLCISYQDIYEHDYEKRETLVFAANAD